MSGLLRQNQAKLIRAEAEAESLRLRQAEADGRQGKAKLRQAENCLEAASSRDSCLEDYISWPNVTGNFTEVKVMFKVICCKNDPPILVIRNVNTASC